MDEMIAALKEETRKLNQLLDDPHPGLFTWCEALDRALERFEQFREGTWQR